jgi:hypothetical protein
MPTITNVNRLVFALIATVSGVVFWWFADWWAYVEYPSGPVPKFIAPWWFQVFVSSIVGVVCGTCLFGSWLVFRKVRGA